MRTQGATSSISGSHNCDDALIYDACSVVIQPLAREFASAAVDIRSLLREMRWAGSRSAKASPPPCAGKRGVVYLPIYERIEAELDALRAKEAQMERARQRLK